MIARMGLRTGLFIGLAYGVNGNLHDVWRWLALSTVANGMEFVAHTVRIWDREERAV